MKKWLNRYTWISPVLILIAIGTLTFGAHELYKNVTASELYYVELSPADGSVDVYPTQFQIRFNQPVTLSGDITGVTLRSLGGYPDFALPNSALSTTDEYFYIDVSQASDDIPIAGGQYRVIVSQSDITQANSSDYPASGEYWNGFPYFCEGCTNQWRVTFANLFTGAHYATPTPSSILDFADFATTVRTRYQIINTAIVGNGITDVIISECAGVVIGSVGTDRPTSVSADEARLVLSQSLVNSLLGTYDASESGANRCINFSIPAGYVRHPIYNLGSVAQIMQYTLKYIAHETLAGSGSVVQPDQIFSADFNQQIVLSATTTTARLFDVDAGVYVASIPMTTGTNAYVGDGDVSDGVASDTLYLDFANVYALEAGKEYQIEIPGIAVRKLNSWDYVRYNIDGAEYSFTVANDADDPQIESYLPSGNDVATSTTQVVLTYDEPVTLSAGTATFDIWTDSVATSSVSSVSNEFESVSNNEYTLDLNSLLQEAFGSPEVLEGTTYWIRISEDAVVDDESNTMDSAYILSFQTVETPEIIDESEGVAQEQQTSRSPSGRRARSGGGGQSGLDSSGQATPLTDPVNEDLSFGDTGEAVFRLQQALNKIGFYVSEEGPGSPGQETRYFATSTRNAVTLFQMNFGILPSVGYFGPITRALLGFILNW